MRNGLSSATGVIPGALPTRDRDDPVFQVPDDATHVLAHDCRWFPGKPHPNHCLQALKPRDVAGVGVAEVRQHSLVERMDSEVLRRRREQSVLEIDRETTDEILETVHREWQDRSGRRHGHAGT